MGKPHNTVVRDTISFTRHKKNVNIFEASMPKRCTNLQRTSIKGVFQKKQTNKTVFYGLQYFVISGLAGKLCF